MSIEAFVTIDQSRLERMLRGRGGIAEHWLRQRTERAAAEARRRAPGSMAAQITSHIEEGPRGLSGVVISHHPATLYVINGTRPHVIRPRRAKALRFDAGGRTVYAKVVHHPGTAANDFLTLALRSAL